MLRVLKRPFSWSLLVIGAVVLFGFVAFVLGGHPGRASTASAAACSPALPHSPGITNETIVSGSVSRSYYLHVPPGYDGTTAVPIVFLFHGRGGTASIMGYYTQLDTKADAEGFILVSPQGVVGPGGQTWWNGFLAPTYPDDVAFVNDMINQLESQLCVDPQRIFSTGISNGAIMSVRLGCSLSSRIAAIAPVAGVYYPPFSTDLTPTETCPDTPPVPLLAIHGTADTLIPFHGGSNQAGDLTGLRDIEAAIMPDWATHNGCSTTPAMSTAAPGVRLVTFPGCADNATTLLYVVEDADGPGPQTEGGGHQWPDAAVDLPEYGLNTHYISATNLIWDFFKAHPLVTSDLDSDGVIDFADNCPRWPNPGQTLPAFPIATSDADCDGFPDNASSNGKAAESFVGTSSTQHCAATTAANDEPLPDAWPVDFNDDQLAGGQDILKLAPVFNTHSPGPPYSVRFDLNGDGLVGGQDILKFAPFFNKRCA